MELLCKIRDIQRSIAELENSFQQNYGMGLNESMLLCSLSKFNKCSSGELAELLGLTCSNTSKVICQAEKKGYVKRVLGEKDKRQMYFTLTEAGIEKIDFIHCNANIISNLLDKIKEI